MERIVCIVPKVFAFRVPPAESSGGYRASKWPKEPMWSGRLRVVQQSTPGSDGMVVGEDKLVVQLEHLDRPGLFASCPVEAEHTVEPVTDSSRYFVLRIVADNGRHAFIGIGFNSRDEAFEFKVALQDNEKGSGSKQRAEEYLDSLPSADFALPEDGMIKVNLKSKKKDKKKDKKKKSAGASGAPLALPPPPKKGEPRATSGKKSRGGGGGGGGVANVLDIADAFGDMDVTGGAGAAPAAAAAAAASEPAGSDDPFATAPAASAGGSGGGADDWVAFD